VASVTSTAPGGAAAWIRAAVLTASPNAPNSTRCPPADGAHDDLPGVDADPDRETLEPPAAPDLLRVLTDHLGHVETGPGRPFRVVLVRGRCAEEGQQPIASEVLHVPAVGLDDRDQPGDRITEDQLGLLGVDLLGEGGRGRRGRRRAS